MTDAKTTQAATQEPPADVDLRSRRVEGTLSPDSKRFDIFLIDTGWNGPVSKAVRVHLPLIYQYQKQDTLYLLSHEQSVEILKRAPDLIGRDPALLVYDLYHARDEPSRNYRGFRLNLGLLRSPEQALSRLQDFVRFIASHRTASHLDLEIKRELHREGLKGVVKILRDASSELL